MFLVAFLDFPIQPSILDQTLFAVANSESDAVVVDIRGFVPNLQDLSGMGDSAGSIATGSIAPRFVGITEPSYQRQAEALRGIQLNKVFIYNKLELFKQNY